jgi:cbb3-type cytochrome oxidase maturation protein
VNVIFILIAISLLVAIGFLISFFWSIRSGQYEDEYTPSIRILFDDEKNVIEENSKSQKPNSKQNTNSKSKKQKQKQNQKQKSQITNN